MPNHATRPWALYSLVAWTGGGVSVGSLLWFLYCYTVRFQAGRSTTAAMVAITHDVLTFSLFAAHHSAFARPRLKRWIATVVPPELERSLYTWIASILFILVCSWWAPLPGVLYTLRGGWALIAYAVQVVAIGLTIQSSAALGMLDLAGVSPLARARKGEPASHVPLETHGLYGFVRHPLYFSWALFVFTTPAMTATRALFAVVSTAYLAIAIPWEERSLIAAFGKEYEAYQRRVRWRLIPGIY
jgi:methanethiol S-methyltransferase